MVISVRVARCSRRCRRIEIAAAVGTPFYVYSPPRFLRHFKAFVMRSTMDHLVCYALKAIQTRAVLNAGTGRCGDGCGVAGDILRAKAAGVR